MRAKQREATREQIVKAALSVISESGYEGSSTRQIALRANVSQGLLTYHFKSKEALWRAAADHVFDQLNSAREVLISAPESDDPREQLRMLLRDMVYLSAEHPEILRFMIDSGRDDNERTRWLVETHARPIFESFSLMMKDIPKADIPHYLYAILGACGVIFSVPEECKLTTGVDPMSKASIKRHADVVIKMMVPD